MDQYQYLSVILLILTHYLNFTNILTISQAQQCFQMVGTSAHECDTIPGRQCMASCFYLMRQFDDVAIYLNSIKAYMYNDDDFNYNHGITMAATRNYKVRYN